MRTKGLFLLALLFALTGPAFPASLPQAPLTVSGATTIDIDAAYRLFRNGALFIDVRKPKAYEMGRIPGAISLPLASSFTAENLATHAAANDAIVIYCGGPRCPLSARASGKAVSWGYRRVHYLRAGLPGWRKAGYPVE